MGVDAGSFRLPLESGSAVFDREGIHLRPWFLRRSLLLPWSNVEFVHVIPGIRPAQDGWKTYDGQPLTADTLRAGQRFYVIQPAVRDRHALLQGYGPIARGFLKVHLLLKPLWTADDKPDPKRGCIKLWLSARHLRKSPEALLGALGLIQALSRFDLLVTED